MKRIRIITLLAIAFLLIISINNIVRAEAGYGEVTAITGSPTISGTGTANVDIKYDTVSLQWAPADTSIGRNKNGYWVGYKIAAPADVVTNEETSKKAVFRTRSEQGEWSDYRSFDNVRDGEWFLNAWSFVDQTIIDKHSTEAEFILYQAQFDWDGDGQNLQTVTIKLNPTSVTLEKSENMSTVIIKELGQGASRNMTTITTPRNKTLIEGAGTSEKTIIDRIRNAQGFVKFYKLTDPMQNFDVDKLDTYTEFNIDTDQITEETVALVAYYNVQPTPAPDATPKTGSVDVLSYALVAIVLSSAGLVVLNKKH